MNGPKTQDVVRRLGYLTLGTRLKRIGERMQAQTQRILDAHDLAVPAGQFPFLASIDRCGPQTIGGLAESVGVTQPSATRSIGHLAEAGFVQVTLAEKDQRRKSVDLTTSGRQLVAEGKRSVWPLIEASVADVCDGLTGGLLEQLEAIEEGLAEETLDVRAATIRSKKR